MGRLNAHITLAGLLIFVLLSIQFFDRPLAQWLQAHPLSVRPILDTAVMVLEQVTGFNISKFLLAGLLLLSAGLCFLFSKWKRTSLALLFVGLTHAVSRLVAGSLKNVFSRTRPYEYLQDNSLPDFFAPQGSSFPSGHVAHFFSLAFPILLLAPKHKWILIIPCLVSAQRIISNDHYVSDVLASTGIALLFTVLFARWLRLPGSNANRI